MNTLKRFITIAIVGIILLIPTSTHAQQLSLSISPPLLEVVIKPGKSILVAYTIYNLADPSVLRATVSTFEPSDTVGNIRIKEALDGPVRFSLDNAEFQMGEPFFVKTKDKKQLLLRIRVPEGAPEGDYYYTLLASSQPSPGGEGFSSSQASGRIGSNILVTVTNSGRVDLKGKISTFETYTGFLFNFFGRQIRIFDSADTIPVKLVVENQGKNLIKPNGDVTLTGNFGEKAVYDILQQNILAQSKRLLIATPSAQLTRPLPEPATLVLSGFFLGRYKLSTQMNFGEGAPNIYGQTTFFAFPIKFFIGFLVVVAVGIYLVRKLGTPRK